MKARFVKGAETRLRIIRAAADLFHKQGARCTSPDQVIDASRTGKGQFYHYFKSKEGLVHEVLQTYLEEIKTQTSRINYEIHSWKDLEKWFAAQVELQKNYEMTRGCPFGTLGNKVTENDELIRQDVSLIFEVVKNKLAAFFVKEKAKGRLAKKANEEGSPVDHREGSKGNRKEIMQRTASAVWSGGLKRAAKARIQKN